MFVQDISINNIIMTYMIAMIIKELEKLLKKSTDIVLMYIWSLMYIVIRLNERRSHIQNVKKIFHTYV